MSRLLPVLLVAASPLVCHTPVHAQRAQLPQSSRTRLYLFLDRTGKPPLREWPNTAPILDASRAGGRKDNYQFAITGCGSQPVPLFRLRPRQVKLANELFV